MSGRLAFAWDAGCLRYDFGPGHPFTPVRTALTVALVEALHLLDDADRPDVTPAGDDLLQLVHTAAYVDAVRAAAASLRPDPAHGLGTPDNPTFAAMHEATARIVGATVAAARAVGRGDAAHGVSIAGGLHHAMPSSASGFCVYNDVAVAIADLLRGGAARIAYVDVDVHHGDGVQEMFWDDPRVLTISLHESGRTLFPGTGFPDEIGGPGATGTAVNVALPAGTTDAEWLRAFDAVVPPLVRRFAPTILVTQHGCDSHALDPLANLLVSVDGQRRAALALHELAHEVCDGRWVATGGGGYEAVRVVPRSWTHLVAIAAGRPVDPDTETPEEWRRHVHDLTHTTAPLRMTDGRDPEVTAYAVGGDPTDPVDAAIRATREAVFPLHGLEP